MRIRLGIAILAATLILAFGGATRADTPLVKPTCADNSRECLLTAAKSYLHAIVTHDGSKALFAPGVRRTEQGGYVLVGQDAMRKSMAMEPDMLCERDTRYFVDVAQRTVVYFTLLPTKGVNADPKRESYPMEGNKDATIHLAERIKVEGGLITEIEAIFYPQLGTLDGTSGWPASH